MNVHFAKMNVGEGKINIAPTIVNVEFGKTNVDTSSANVEFGKTNIGFDKTNVDDSKTNVGNPSANVAGHISNVASRHAAGHEGDFTADICGKIAKNRHSAPPGIPAGFGSRPSA
ncbi:hypothetical protein [Flaviaesturariibacter aridisoli]|uniref:Uncharacterized protein n=1 Tax=Flaviaesturariibacter aridisoli TaxID=2545761 RepID=A0A4R4E497_9BACT|nr:hypothetical protein [Flaviaesturariibacter aridisoli]TCZ73663.1 hypothetical protein E0486_05110 [Flaviaesturariibacter aridisoli]